MNNLFDFDEFTFKNEKKSIDELKKIAKEIRKDIIKSLYLAKSGHSGGPIGLADIFSVLFFNGVMNYDAHNPQWDMRDRFVLSAGHLAPVLYSTLARAGFFPSKELATLRKFGSRLQGHPALDVNLPGIETASGSLGQGISIAVGIALNDKYLDKKPTKVFSLTGDGELQEGSTWESAMAASNYKLNNLCWIVDNNDCQIDGRVHDVMSIYPIKEKFIAFGFNTIEINGHNYDEIIKSFEQFNLNFSNSNKPTVIIAKTFMGSNISFMHDNYKWHGIPPNKEQAIQALEELERS